jgi:hypothetical protein
MIAESCILEFNRGREHLTELRRSVDEWFYSGGRPFSLEEDPEALLGWLVKSTISGPSDRGGKNEPRAPTTRRHRRAIKSLISVAHLV